jgi:hypothetical protein
MDVILSSGDEAGHSLMPDVLADLKVLAADKARDAGATSVEALAPSPIGADAPGNPRTPVVDRVAIVPLSGEHGRKCLHLAAKRSDPVPRDDQVMTQFELPPYRGPCSPVNLVAIEIVFGRVFEAFH